MIFNKCPVIALIFVQFWTIDSVYFCEFVGYFEPKMANQPRRRSSRQKSTVVQMDLGEDDEGETSYEE